MVPEVPHEDPLSFLEGHERSDLAPVGVGRELVKGVGMEIRNMLGAAVLDMIPFGKAFGFLIKAQGIYRAARQRALSKINELRLTEHVVTATRVARDIEDHQYTVRDDMRDDLALLARRKKQSGGGTASGKNTVHAAIEKEIVMLQDAARAFGELELQLEMRAAELEKDPQDEGKQKEAISMLDEQSNALLAGEVPSVQVAAVSGSVADEASALLHRPSSSAELTLEMRERIKNYNDELCQQYKQYRYSALNAVRILHGSILHCLPKALIRTEIVTENRRGGRLHWVDDAVIPINDQMRIEMKRCAFNDFGGWKQGKILIFTDSKDKEPAFTLDGDYYGGDYVLRIDVRDNPNATLYDDHEDTLQFSDRIRDIGLHVAEACARMGGGPKSREE